MNISRLSQSSDALSRLHVILPDYEKILLCSLNCLAMVIGLIGNVLVIAVIRMYEKDDRTSSMIILGSLALSDILVIVEVQPLYVYSFFHSIIRGSILYKISQASRWALLLTSVLHLLAVSGDRYLAICTPNLYHLKLRYTKLWCYIVLIIIWFFAMVVGVTVCIIPTSATVKQIVHFLCIAVMMCLIFVHIRLFFVARDHRKQIKQQQAVAITAFLSPEEETEENSLDLMEQTRSERRILAIRDIKAFTTTSIVCGAFILSWLPLLILGFITRSVNGDAKGTILHIFPYANTLALFNSSQNPFIYCFHIESFRVNLKKLIKRQN